MKTMNKIIITAFFTFTFSNCFIAQVNIEESGNWNIAGGGTLNVAGLEISPESDYVLAGPNSVEMSLTSISIAGSESMAKHFTVSQNLPSFSGALVYNHEEEDMNGISHDASLQVLDSPDGEWTTHEDHDDDDFSITHNFENPTEIHKVTAHEASLSVETIDGEMVISVFPNPTSNIINVSYDKEVELALFNMLGQELIKTNDKNIDISNFEKGNYILIVKTIDSGNFINFNVVKK